MARILSNIEKFIAGASLIFGLNSCNYNAEKVEVPKVDSSAYYKVDSLNDRGWKLMETSPKVALLSYEEARKIAEKIDYKKGEGLSYLREGVLYDQKGDYQEVVKNYSKALEIFKSVDDSLRIGAVYNNLGNFFSDKGEYDKSVKNFLEAVKFYSCSGAPPEKIANTYGNIGIIFGEEGKNKRAMEYYKKDSLILSDLLKKDSSNLKINYNFANVLNNIGVLVKKMEKGEEFKRYYNGALKFANKSRYKGIQSIILINFANYYKEKKEYDKAYDSYKKSLKINKEMRNKDGVFGNLIGLNYLDIKKGDYNSAFKNLKDAEGVAKELGDLVSLSDLNEAFYNFYKERGDYENSLKYHEKYLELHDSIFNSNSTKQIAEMETRYRTEKKEQENKLLVKEGKLKESKIESQKKILWGGAGAFTLISLLSLGLLNAYNKKNKAKKTIEQKNKDINDSLNYARKIQEAILPREKGLERLLGDNFVLFKPKEVVSGDFYWASEKNNKSYFAACDCTGHGVPGAFMSVLNSSLLSEAVNEKGIEKPNNVFDEVRKRIVESLKSRGELGDSKEGMDAVLCSLDRKNKTLEFAVANNPLYLIRGGELKEFKGDRMAVGYSDKLDIPFKENKINLKEGDLVYIFSDGYQDQFGGPKGKKFRPKQLKEVLLSISNLPMEAQKQKLEEIIENWMGEEEQIDDILVMGVRYYTPSRF